MSSARPLTHSRWLKGLQAGFDRYAQPKGSFARASNLLLTRRGALKACDGTGLITQFNAAFQAAFGPITEIFLYQPTGANAGYFGIVKDSFTHIGVPTGLFLANVSSGVLTGTFTYVITALDGAGGETVASIQIQITPSAQKIQFTWTPVPNAVGGYNIYRTVSGGALGTEHFLVTVPGQSSASYTDNLPDSSLGAGIPPVTDTTQVCQFYSFTFPSYTTAQRVLTLPADLLTKTGGGAGGGYGGSGSGSGGSSGYNPPTPSGGVFGNLSPLPMIVQFVNKMMMALGNGITPYQSDGTTPGTIPIVNTFVAAYPTWAASTVFNQGDQIQVTVSAVNYVFTATQGGETGSGSAPAFVATLGSTVADGNIIWKNSGQVSNSPPPRGAAHEEVYAGSLWVANTGVSLSSDQLDGPSALRMSDLNAPTSWNPLNAAQIQPDDGDQCTGIKAFTIAEAGIAPQNFLTYFKNFSAFVIQGVFGSSDFSITRLQTDMGCVAPRTLQFVPGYGIMRLTHLGFAVTDGISDKLQDPEAIRPYLFPESTESDITPIDQSYIYFAKAAQTSNPPMYVCAMPLQGLASAIFGGVAVVGLSGPALLMNTGEYYIKIQAVTTTGQTYTSGEYAVSQAIIRVGGHIYGYPIGIAITLPNVSVVTEWNIYMGTAPGQEDEFITIPNGVPSVTITNSTVFTAGEPVTTQEGSLSRLFCYDLILKAWTVVDLPFPISVLKQFRTPGSSPITVMGGFYDGAIRRWQAGDSVWDGGATNAGAPSTNVQWAFRDAEVFAEGGTVQLFHNQVVIRGDGGPSSILVSPTINGEMQATIQAALIALGQNQYEARVRLLQTAENLNLTVSGSGPATVESISYQVEQKPAGAALVYS
jgi:hypothetical protein